MSQMRATAGQRAGDADVDGPGHQRLADHPLRDPTPCRWRPVGIRQLRHCIDGAQLHGTQPCATGRPTTSVSSHSTPPAWGRWSYLGRCRTQGTAAPAAPGVAAAPGADEVMRSGLPDGLHPRWVHPTSTVATSPIGASPSATRTRTASTPTTTASAAKPERTPGYPRIIGATPHPHPRRAPRACCAAGARNARASGYLSSASSQPRSVTTSANHPVGARFAACVDPTAMCGLIFTANERNKGLVSNRPRRGRRGNVR